MRGETAPGRGSGLSMKRKKHTPQQILEKLRTVEAENSQGRTLAEIARKLEASEPTRHRWRNQ